MIPAPRRSGAPRQGNPVLAEGEPAGLVTSGTFSPSLEQGIGMAYVRRDLAEPGTELEIDVRGRRRAARVEKRPLLALCRRERLDTEARFGEGGAELPNLAGGRCGRKQGCLAKRLEGTDEEFSRLSGPSPAMVVACVALSFALAGSAVAGTDALNRADHQVRR